MHINIYAYKDTHIYIYIYVHEGERERVRERDRGGERGRYVLSASECSVAGGHVQHFLWQKSTSSQDGPQEPLHPVTPPARSRS